MPILSPALQEHSTVSQTKATSATATLRAAAQSFSFRLHLAETGRKRCSIFLPDQTEHGRRPASSSTAPATCMAPPTTEAQLTAVVVSATVAALSSS